MVRTCCAPREWRGDRLVLLLARQPADVRAVQAARADESRRRRVRDDRFGAVTCQRAGAAADDAALAGRARAGFDASRVDADRFAQRARFSETGVTVDSLAARTRSISTESSRAGGKRTKAIRAERSRASASKFQRAATASGRQLPPWSRPRRRRRDALSSPTSTRRAPRQILISGEHGRSSGLSMTLPATLLAWTKRRRRRRCRRGSPRPSCPCRRSAGRRAADGSCP